MFRVLFFLAALAAFLWTGAASAASSTVSPNFVSAGSGPANTVTISNASGAAIANYPFQFGRPFLAGAIPHVPRALINGQLVTTQADVKNRYPDGSAEFAVMAVVIPAIPASGSLTMSFQDTTATSTPMTMAAMEALLPPGAASMVLTPAVGGSAGGGADAGIMLAAGFCAPWTAGSVAQTMSPRQ